MLTPMSEAIVATAATAPLLWLKLHDFVPLVYIVIISSVNTYLAPAAALSGVLLGVAEEDGTGRCPVYEYWLK
jgi:energy-converting hydrogenase Eha subunit G